MTRERWRQIEEVYHAALDREPDVRGAYLAEACASDEELRSEVESLLKRDTPSPDIFLNQSPWPAGENTLKPGTRLGPYEILDPLGAGGMGQVYKARDTRLGRVVALKISKSEFSQRFEREARAVASLNHPHICALYDVGPNYFVMEYVDGKPLQQLIPRKGLPLALVLNYAEQIADALAAAHAAGIVHRDLKPGNIMVSTDGRVKVVDFGLARVTAHEPRGPDDTTLTQSAAGTIAGTVSYMSPEQAQGRPVDARSDVFSFGAVLYEMLTGARAFHGDSPVSTLADILNKDPRPAGELAAQLPREVETLLNRCLRKDPARRWQDMADVKVALLELKEDSDSGKLVAAIPAVLRKRRGSMVWFAIAAGVCCAAAALWYFARPHVSAGIAYTAVPLTSYPGEQVKPAFSPEGNQVAFTWNGPHRDNWDIYVKVVGEGEPLRLTSDPADEMYPSWSPDGRWIVYCRALPANRYALMLVSPLGGSGKRLGEFGSPREYPPGFAWSRDSRHIVIPVNEEENHRNGLFDLSLDTGDVRQLTHLDVPTGGDTNPAVSPDGRTMAFSRLRDNTLTDLCVLGLGSDLSPRGGPRVLAPGVIAGSAWTADGKELVYASGPPGRATLKRVSAFGTPVTQTVPASGDSAYYPAISGRTGGGVSRLAWSHPFKDANIYRLELSHQPEKAGGLRALIASSFRDVFPQYSPDGKTVVFYSNRTGATEIRVCQADGSACRQITNLGAVISGSPRWSPDGKQIAFDSNKDGIYQFYIVSAEGGTPRRMTGPPSVSFAANWSLDGKWIYFTCNRNGPLNVWKMPSSGGPAEQITHQGGIAPTVSPDGKFLYYVKDANNVWSSLWRVPVTGGAEEQVIPRIHRYSFAVTDRGMYFSVPNETFGSGGTIEFLEAATGKLSVLARTDKALELGLSVSPDGRYLLYPQIDFQASNLMMIDNFR